MKNDTITDSYPEQEGIKLTKENEEKLKAAIDAAYANSSAARDKWRQDKAEGLALYWGVRREKNFPFSGCANLHVPLIRTICETLHSNLKGSLDMVKPVSIMPVGPEDVPKAHKSEKLINWQFTTQVDFEDLADKVIQSMLVFGTAPVKLRYCVEREDGKKVFDGLKAEVLLPERVLVPGDACDSDVESMDFIIHEMPMSKSDIIKRKNSGTYKISAEELKGIAETYKTNPDNQSLENLRDYYSGVDSQETDKARPFATVLEYYGYFDINGDGVDEPIMVSYLKEKRVILRVVKQRKRPLILINFSDIFGKALGESVPDLLVRINQELNTLHNQRVDAVTITNVPYFFFDPAAGFNPDEVKLTPGLGIPVNGSPSQAVYFPAMNTARPEMFREEDNLFLYAERLLGAGSNVQGILQSKRVTATEVQAVDRRAGIRFLTIFNRLRKGLRKVFRMALELDREHMPKEIQVRITGFDKSKPTFETFKRDDMEAQLDIVINGNSIIDDQAEKQEMMQAYQVGMINPLITRDPIAIYELTRDLFVKLGIKRVDSYLRRPMDEIPKTPEEEHNLFLQEEYPEPNLQENIDEHLKKHGDFINSDNFKILSKHGKVLAIRHYEDTQRMKATIEQLQIIQRMQQVNSMLLQSQLTGAGPEQLLQGQAGQPGQVDAPIAGGPNG